MSKEKFGVPMEDGTRGQITMPWYSYRFRVASRSEGVTLNVENVSVDFVAKTVQINARATINPEHFLDAMRFNSFRLDCMDAAKDKPVFSIIPQGLKLTGHSFDLAYAASQSAMHLYTFAFEDMGVQAPEPTIAVVAAPVVDDDGFMTPAEALKSLEEKKGLTGGRQLLNEVPTKPFAG